MDFRCGVLGALLLIGVSERSPGQPVDQAAVGDRSLDSRLLLSVYHIEHPVFAAGMYAADAVAYPVFYGAVPAAWLGAIVWRKSEDYRDAYLLTLSFAGSYAASTLLKKAIRRPRPSADLAAIRVRNAKQHEWEELLFEYSFPSGHAAMAFTIVTSYSLSHPKWYVIAPGYAWAATTALSRVWRGRHYPSDVLGGMLLGSMVAGAFHLAAHYITPPFIHEEEERSPLLPPVTLLLRF